MDEHSLSTAAFDRAVQQAIVSMKKGAYLLRYGRRGKPKFCPFRLSTDEKFFIWNSGKEERHLKLSSVTKIVPGQRNVSSRRQLEPERDRQSFSLVYAHGEHSLDLICKDEVQCDHWILGLRALLSRSRHLRPLDSLGSFRQAQSCVNSPAGLVRRKKNLGILDDATEFSQVRSVCGSPLLSLSERCFSEGLSYSSDSFYSWESVLSNMQNVMDISVPNSPYIDPDHLKRRRLYNDPGYEPQRFVTYAYGSSRIEKDDILKDVMIWGESIGGNVDGLGITFGSDRGLQVNSLLPKLLESIMMLDVQNVALGEKHAALVTKQGEVFCWGEAKWGRLGNKIGLDVSHPKLVDSLNGIQVKSVSCGGYQTCALTHSGNVYTWGDTSCGAHLAGEEKNCSRWLPHRLSGPLNDISISYVSCGEWHTALLSTSGQVFTYGDGTFGVLGHGNLHSVSQPKEVESLKGLWVKSVACGSWHTAAVVEIMVDRMRFNFVGGKLFTWGDSDEGKLGHVDNERKLLPTCVAQLVDHEFIQVCCGRMLTVGLTSQGTVYTMGSAKHGQLGNAKAKDKSIIVVEGKLKDEFIREMASGSYHIAALTARGSVYTWGKGKNGQLGLGDKRDRNTPTFVEALRDRQVESIICGSNSTAAICLHKSVSVSDQAACYGCNLPFGFTRKKHNCYNCGLVFCYACRSKKVMDASLAPKKGKGFRVCDPCFNNLQKLPHSSRSFKQEIHCTKQLVTEEKSVPHGKEDKAGSTPKLGHLLSSNKECHYGARNQEENHLQPISSLSSREPRWGQVPCPALFKPNWKDNSSESVISSDTNPEKCVSVLDEMLIEEVKRLRAQAISLQRKYQIRSLKIQAHQQKIEEMWSFAREEAATCKALRDVIKDLELRHNTMSEMVGSIGRQAHGGVYAILPQLRPLNTNTSTRRLLPEVCTVSNSPSVFSGTPKSLYERDSSEEFSHVTKTVARKKETKAVNLEWVEQYEPGVYVTLVVLPCGQKWLKRVRFSRRKFTDKEAKQWWEVNQALVYHKYDIKERYENSTGVI